MAVSLIADKILGNIWKEGTGLKNIASRRKSMTTVLELSTWICPGMGPREWENVKLVFNGLTGKGRS